jgi:hypothetical protein
MVLRRIFACAVIWMAISHAALGQERYALLIGNKDYSAKIGVLNNPLNDVALVRMRWSKRVLRLKILKSSEMQMEA